MAKIHRFAIGLLCIGLIAFGFCIIRVAFLKHNPGKAFKRADIECKATMDLPAGVDPDNLSILFVNPAEAAFGRNVEICISGVVARSQEVAAFPALNKDDQDTRAATAAARDEKVTAEKTRGDIATKDAAYQQAVSAEKEARATLDAAVASSEAAKGTVELWLYLNAEKAPKELKLKARAISGAQILPLRFAPPEDAKIEVGQYWQRILSGGATDVDDSPVEGSGINARFGIRHNSKALQVGLSRSDLDTPETTWDGFKLALYERWAFWGGILSFLLLAASFGQFARNSTILRDNRKMEGAKPVGSYSLARTQMAFWLGLTVLGFMFLWLTVGQYNGLITTSVLALLGISGATGLAAVNVNPDSTTSKESQNFLLDLVDGGDGPQLYRIQAVLWTLILGLIFIWNVFYNFKFVDFGTELLVLIGFFNSLYLGFKTQEPPKA